MGRRWTGTETKLGHHWGSLIVMALAVLALAAGCAMTQQAAAPEPAAETHATPSHAQFLSDYDRLQPVAGDEDAKSWIHPKVDWTKYDKVMIAPIQVFLKEDAKYKGIDPNDLKQLVDYFHDAMVKEIQPVATVVEKPGPGVLVARLAIVDLVPTKAWQSAVGTATPYGFVAEIAAGEATGRKLGSTPYLGETGIEAQFVNGASGEILAEYTDTEVGRKYVIEMDKDVPQLAEKWAKGYIDSFTTWGYAKQAFNRWAKLFRQRYEQLRGTNKS